MLALLTVSGGRIALHNGRTYVMGRGADCDIVAEDMACSRHHAKLIVDDAGNVFIADLKSRNGVLVNGEKISGKAPLRVGARVQIGASVYLLSLLTVAAREQMALLDSGTIQFDAAKEPWAGHGDLFPGSGNADIDSDFGGQLGAIGLADVLEMLVKANRCGTLNVELEKGSGRVEIRDGQIRDATCDELKGFQALVMMARARKGIFWLVDNAAPCAKTFRDAGAKVLFELRRAMGRSNRPAWR